MPNAPSTAAPIRFLRDRRGVTAVEFALLAIPFFLVLFSVIETSLVFTADLLLDQAVAHAGRSVRIGEAASAAMTQAGLKQSICSEVSALLSCDRLMIDLQAYAKYEDLPSSAPMKNGAVDPAAMKFDLGGPNRIMALRAYYDWPIVTDLIRSNLSDMASGGHLLASVEVFKTEPY